MDRKAIGMFECAGCGQWLGPWEKKKLCNNCIDDGALGRVGREEEATITDDSAEGAPVPRAVYEDLVVQNQALAAKVVVIESDNSDLEYSRDKWKDMHRDKCVELEAELDRMDKVRKALDAD